MAIGVSVELPLFLHQDSLNYEIKSHLSNLQEKYPHSSTLQGAQEKVFGVIETEITRRLEDQSIVWNFGTPRAMMKFSHGDEKIQDPCLGDEIIAAVSDVVQSAIFITTSALDSLCAKEVVSPIRA